MEWHIRLRMSWLGEITFHFTIKYHLLLHTLYIHDMNRNGEVNLNMMTSICCMFNLDIFSYGCKVAAYRVRGVNHRQLCDLKYSYTFMVMSYVESIYPMSHHDYLNVIDDVLTNLFFFPWPNIRRKETKKRKLNIGEVKRFTKCSKCNKSNHNKETCKRDLQMVVKDTHVVEMDELM